MPITTQWYDPEETILLETFSGVWDIKDYMRLIDEAAEMLRQKSHLVHVIANFSDTKLVPHQVLTGVRYAEEKLPSNQGIVVFVQPGGVISAFIKVAKQMGFKATAQLFVADDLETAIKITREKGAPTRG